MLNRRDIWTGISAAAGLACLPRLSQATPLIIRVPISFAPNGMPILQLTIGGQGPYRFLLDMLHRFTIGCDKSGRLCFRPNRYFSDPNAGLA